MCGIAGVLDRHGAAIEPVHSMTAALHRRGPDHQATWVSADGCAALGHARLAVQDPSPAGHQPMASADGRLQIVFNGEIYNFRDIARALPSGADSLRSGSDTEVLLAAIRAWGLQGALDRAVGMFAFALYDSRERRLTLVRDRLGIKPLYLCETSGGVVFGSTLAALRCHPGVPRDWHPDALATYLRYGYVRGRQALLRGVERLLPGTLVSFAADGERWQRAAATYWSVDEVAAAGAQRPFKGTPADAAECLQGLLEQAVHDRLVSDVPLGALLSGGVDSSLVVATMQRLSAAPVKTFSIGFSDNAFDESEHAAAVARHLGTDHTELTVTPQAAMAVLPELPSVFDEPFADPSQIPTLLVSRLARQSVTVALSGDGGDELFAGYRRYADTLAFLERTQRLPSAARRGIARALRGMPVVVWDALLTPIQALGRATALSGDRLQKLAPLFNAGDTASVYERLQALWDRAPVLQGQAAAIALRADLGALPLPFLHADSIGYLPDDILTKVDRASMACSLEARVPLLDHRLVEFVWRLPADMRCQPLGRKALLRTLLARSVPPTLTERPKQGFAVPLADWLRGPLREWAEDLLSPASLAGSGLLDVAAVRGRWHSHLAGQRDWHRSLWAVLMLEAWRTQGTVQGDAGS